MIYNKKEYILWNLIYSNAKVEKLNYDEVIYLFLQSINERINLFKKFETLILKAEKKDRKTKTYLNLLKFFEEKKYLKYKKNIVEIEKNCIENNIKMLFFEEEKFPMKLKNIFNPPIMLYYKGKFEDKGNILTIAGNREIGKYGKTIVNKVVELFSKKNYVILSGLALGTDTEAHISALNNNLKTFAILGQGISSKIYPNKNLNLSKKILENDGCLISEIEPFKNPNKDYFLRRNRLQAGLADKIFIGAIKENGGGTLTTISYALKYNKKIYIWNPILIYQKNKMEIMEKSFLGNLILFNDYPCNINNNNNNKLINYKKVIIQNSIQILIGKDFYL
jgi:DNA processing chain A